MADNLEDILNPQEPEQPQPEPEAIEPPEPQPEPAPQPGEEPSPSPGEPQPVPQPAPEDPAAAARAAVRAELEALSKERQRIRAKEEALEAERLKLAQPKADFWDDPEKRLAEIEQRTEQLMQKQRLDISEMYAKDRHEDYGEKLEIFKELVQANPALYHQMLNESNPAEFAYRQAVSHVKLKEMGDPMEFEQKLREKIKAEMEAELTAQFEARKAAEVEAAIKAKLGKGGFVETRSVATNSTKQPYQGPTPLGAILK